MIGGLNGVCAYFTMFPLEFPLRILRRYAAAGEVVLDPFAGRGTTLYAGRVRSLWTFGIDSNPVAVAISQGKLANTTPQRIVGAAKRILATAENSDAVPTGEFWNLAFDAEVLRALCRLRGSLRDDCRSSTRKALRAVILGALHGPAGKTIQSYFSNQCPRTFAPKPRYAVGFWRQRGLVAPKVDVIDVIRRRADRFYSGEATRADGKVVVGDSRERGPFAMITSKVSWIITSPPYYGMRTYTPDQWLRNWFVGGPANVSYCAKAQLRHSSKSDFAEDLKKVWLNCARVSKRECRMIIRFGAINDRSTDALALLKESLVDTGWRVTRCMDAGMAGIGRRQANHFCSVGDVINEYDVWTTME